ncbi:Hsp70 family protein [Aneurinibacillus tyrosinisolvens]|uniref:Hsp70 family protein n=1 Tax=Aneurinibacillus tyrosinisolvens TaxID=1443435 RepID=UPI000A9E70FD|nr:Hsp70 family protein [Aneurinibacillus tyrosinisolvens]
MSTTFRPIVGIDLGTTNSAVSYIHKGKPEIIPSPRKERIIPSVVLIDPQGHIVVGEDARAALVAMPDRTIAAVKRKMGSSERISIAGQALLPQEISALILKELKSYVDEKLGEGEKEAVITVPAYFTDEQRRATKQAGELAGFVVERIINEPTAAALAFGLRNKKKDGHVLVYDLGGGTFDVSLVEMMSGLMEVKASSGNNELGGEDFDWRLVDWFAEQIMAEQGIDPRNDIRAKALLKEEAERVKKGLSDDISVNVELPVVTMKEGAPVGLFTTVTRERFISLIDDLLEETMVCVQNVLRDAGLQKDDIDEILLVGGSTRIPRVYERIENFLGKQPRNDVNPDEAVALGAGVQAGLKSGALAKSGLVVTDVAPFSMGIAVLKEAGFTSRPGGFATIIPRNTTIPVTKTEQFHTVYPGQTAVQIEIYQGEHEWVKYNHKLGEFLLEGIPANMEQEEAINVTFRYNLNGILEVTASCVSTGEAMKVTIQDAINRDSEAAIAESVRAIEELYAQSKEAGDEEEEWELEELLADAEWDEDEDIPAEELQTEAERLLKQAERLRASAVGRTRRGWRE